MEHVHDAIVVGSGCAGGWVAKELTEAGLDVLLLEAGPHVDPGALAACAPGADASRRAWARWFAPRSQGVQARHGSFRRENAAFFVDDIEHPYTTPDSKPFFWIRGRQVGGRSLTWGRLCLRLSRFELAAGQLDDKSADWPVSYEELAPHYSAVERFLHVRGSLEGLAQLPDGDYLPAASLTPGEEWLRTRLSHQWPDRQLIPARGIDFDSASDCRWPRFTSTGSTLAAAHATGRLQLRSDAVVRQVFVTDGKSRVDGVHWIDRSNQTEHEARARVVIMCASTIETARILLNSATRGHRNGLGNSADVLGRYLMDHPYALMCGHGDFPRACSALPLEGPHGFVIPRFRNLTRAEGRGYTRGFGIWGGVDRARFFDGGFMFVAYGEMLPQPENRVTLSRTRCDRSGMPLAHIECAWGPNEELMMSDALECLHEMAAGAHLQVTKTVELSRPGEYVHEVGTARMGTEPGMSYVNPECQNWELDNLFVADGGVWTTSGYQNPTLTTMALARRCAHGIVRRFRAGSL